MLSDTEYSVTYYSNGRGGAAVAIDDMFVLPNGRVMPLDSAPDVWAPVEGDLELSEDALRGCSEAIQKLESRDKRLADHNAKLKRRAVPRAPTNDELLLRDVSALFRLLARMR